ncbi:hypothetical protein Pcinc_003884 [Petrolisthes cinctipes]|uniref:Uncharacterized protein n=1 Tax=Petrolisthes cinctipes TaxID=88211 RepID=A0AAE1GMM4_PETCI|nr:hypothetical protein Pcinc_003884 [Petrolisthes cinctipes]
MQLKLQYEPAERESTKQKIQQHEQDREEREAEWARAERLQELHLQEAREQRQHELQVLQLQQGNPTRGANEWKEDAEKLQQLIPLLSGPAFDFYCRLDESTTKTYSSQKKALEDEFDAPGLQQNYAIEFNNRSRGKDETLEGYVD